MVVGFLRPATLLKTQVFCCEFCEIPKNTFSYRTPLVATSKRINLWFWKSCLQCLEIPYQLQFSFFSVFIRQIFNKIQQLSWTQQVILNFFYKYFLIVKLRHKYIFWNCIPKFAIKTSANIFTFFLISFIEISKSGNTLKVWNFKCCFRIPSLLIFEWYTFFYCLRKV